MEETNDKKYCVYMHISPSNKRYIGITSISPPEDRWKNGHGYRHNEYFSRAIDKYGWENFQHQIIANDLTEDEAIEMEISLISEYNTTNINYGYNLTSGGEVGKIYRKEAREKLEIADDEIVLFFRAQNEFKGTPYIVEAMKLLDTTKNSSYSNKLSIFLL